MERRIFLGWDRPFVGLAADWLLRDGPDLADTLVIVPSSQSGRQLRHQLASRAGALLSPGIRTPGSLMKPQQPELAPDWLERLAWQDVLEQGSSAELIAQLFETPAEQAGPWAGSLATEFVQLRRSLQENGLLLRDASRRLGNSPDGTRWQALATLESKVERWLSKAGRISRSRCLSEPLSLPQACTRVVMAGIAELPPVLERQLLEHAPDLHILVAAPESMAEHFSDSGLPTGHWARRSIAWPREPGGVHVAVDDPHQAKLARQAAATAGTDVEELALGTADIDAGDAIAREFSAAGWVAHHPASPAARGGLRRWLGTWNQWLLNPDLAVAGELLALPETSRLLDSPTVGLARSLCNLRDRWMARRPEDLRHQLRDGRDGRDRKQAYEVLTALEVLERWRRDCLAAKSFDTLRQLLDALSSATFTPDQRSGICDWLDQAEEFLRPSRRPLCWWIELMLQDLPEDPTPPPPGRLLDVQGWLELLYEPGSHLILCGVNEGRLPSSSVGDPWLGEAARTLLGLRTDAIRAARDAYLLTALCQARLATGGRVDLICSRGNARGEPMMPSRLLLAGDREELSQRIRHLFAELEPPDARLRWQADQRWTTPTCPPGDKLNATAFSDYLACPYRYYLKHVLRMRGTEPDRIEWNARDFGNIIHRVLEAWGRDPDARQTDQAEAIHSWLSRQLDEEVAAAFGEQLPLAVRIQMGAARQRLLWFARIQAEHRQQGWEVIEVECDATIQLEQSSVRAKIDRIDRHCDSGELLVIDYKTSSADTTAISAHRSMWRSNSRLPEHISEEDPVLYEREDDKGRSKTWRWQNLQLPLYAMAIQEREGSLPTPCYFKLGETEAGVALQQWQDFDQEDVDAARACALWVAERIRQQSFWPPASKVQYDDYERLWCGHPPEELAEPLNSGN